MCSFYSNRLVCTLKYESRQNITFRLASWKFIVFITLVVVGKKLLFAYKNTVSLVYSVYKVTDNKREKNHTETLIFSLYVLLLQKFDIYMK